MTLKEITDLLEVRHNDAMRTVEKMQQDQSFGIPTKISYVIKRTTGNITIQTYQLDKRQSIAVASRLNITIGHKTKLGKVSPIITYGNHLREQRGLSPIDADKILRKQDFWEFVIARNTQNCIEMQTPDSGVWEYQSDYSQHGNI